MRRKGSQEAPGGDAGLSGGGDGDGFGGGPADCRTADVSKPAGLEAVLAKASPESNANFDNIYIYMYLDFRRLV
jgi:hypothetical protein